MTNTRRTNDFRICRVRIAAAWSVLSEPNTGVDRTEKLLTAYLKIFSSCNLNAIYRQLYILFTVVGLCNSFKKKIRHVHGRSMVTILTSVWLINKFDKIFDFNSFVIYADRYHHSYWCIHIIFIHSFLLSFIHIRV